MQSYTKSIEWAADYDRLSIDKYEFALRHSFIDSLCEQFLDGKAVKNKEGVRSWEPTQVPNRLTNVAIFAAYLIPGNQTFKFKSLRDRLSTTGNNQLGMERNKYRLIQINLKKKAEEW